MIEIDSKWRTFGDYAAATPRCRQVTREWKAFATEGVSFAWLDKLDGPIIREFVSLELELLRSKGETVTHGDVEEYYTSLSRHMASRVLAIVARRGSEMIGFVMFLVDGETLVGKAIGMANPRPKGLYFNMNYYEPIMHAIENGFRNIDHGPAAGTAKKNRGFAPKWLMGAFKFDRSHPAFGAWAEVASVLDESARARWS